MNTPSWLFLAQADSLTGGAGWVGAGLLGLVLAWLLLKHLPAKDAQIEGIISRHLAIEERQRAEYATWLNRQRDDFRQMLAEMIDHSRIEIETLTRALGNDLQALRGAVESLRLLMEKKLQ